MGCMAGHGGKWHLPAFSLALPAAWPALSLPSRFGCAVMCSLAGG